MYDASDAQKSLLAAAIGTGAVLVAPILTARTNRVQPSVRVRNAIVFYCAAMLLLASVPLIVVGGIALLAVGASHIAANATLNSVIQLDVDDAWRGKVMSVYLMTVNAGTPIGAMGMGVMVDRVGAAPIDSSPARRAPCSRSPPIVRPCGASFPVARRRTELVTACSASRAKRDCHTVGA